MDSVRSVWTSDEGTMAKETAAHRWPKIVQGMIDDVQATCDSDDCSVEQKAEGQLIITKLTKLKDDIASDASLLPLADDGTSSDIAGYNMELSSLPQCSWRKCPWLYAECYMYRYVQIVFSSSRHWKAYDVFRRQKNSTLRMSRRAVEELAHQFVTGVLDANHSTAAGIHGDQAAQVIFREMTELALWGNATDLSLLTNLSLHDIQKLQTKRAAEENERSIVADDLAEVWQLLRQNRGLPKERRRMDIILDNAGFELFTDVLYASYLLEAGFASGITLHAKSFPWFVSDVTAPDWDSLLEQLEDPKVFPVREHLDLLLACIKRHVDAGSLRLQVHPFWTTHHSFGVLSHEAPDLMKQLQDSYLTIWKGDLNYRKLTRDGLWPHTTPFQDALGQLGHGSGVRILSLRTNKSDTCVGVSEKRVLELEQEAPDKAWVKNGKYAVMSFSDGL